MQLVFDQHLTGVEHGGVDPALSVADRHLAGGVAEKDFSATSPGSWCHPVCVVAGPVPHQHAFIIVGVQLNVTKSRFFFKYFFSLLWLY